MIYDSAAEYKYGKQEKNFFYFFLKSHLQEVTFSTLSQLVCCVMVMSSHTHTKGRTHTHFHGTLLVLTPITKPNNTPLHIHHSWIWLEIWFIYLFSDGTSLSLFSLVNNSIKMSTTALLYIIIMCNKASRREQVCSGTMGRGRHINTQPLQHTNTISADLKIKPEHHNLLSNYKWYLIYQTHRRHHSGPKVYVGRSINAAEHIVAILQIISHLSYELNFWHHYFVL